MLYDKNTPPILISIGQVIERVISNNTKDINKEILYCSVSRSVNGTFRVKAHFRKPSFSNLYGYWGSSAIITRFIDVFLSEEEQNWIIQNEEKCLFTVGAKK
jgi:hypothetical protein